MKMRAITLAAGTSLAAMLQSNAIHAQTPGAEADFSLEEIVVTARRRDERLVDVPVSVNAVTAEEITKLNFRQFEDVKNVVPGLSLRYDTEGTGASAAIRGVKMDVAASGYNGTVEFYLNDTPIIAEALFPLMYDVGQVEVLRGPQGTLRGRASPSGSITVTTRRPDLNEFGGSVNLTGTNIGGRNGNAALNIPIFEGKLAVRLAGAYDDNEFNRVESTFGGPDPFRHVKSGRASVRFEPTDSLSFDVTYQKLDQKLRFYDQYESANIADSTLGASPSLIEADDREGLSDTANRQHIKYDNVNYRAQWAFAGQHLNYAGAYNTRHLVMYSSLDSANVFSATFPAFVQNLETLLDSEGTTRAHELRLSSEERVFGMFDYILGAFYQKTDSPTDLERLTPVFTRPGPIGPTTTGLVNVTPIQRGGSSTEKSGFANLTWHVGEKTEISGGVRYIDYHNEGTLRIAGALLDAATEDSDDSTWIYTGSVKYNFNDDLMVYASTGSSWRPSVSAIGDFSIARSDLENSFLVLPPEKSKSYEIGFKASALDKRLQGSVALFHQKFDNYPYRSASSIFFRETAADAPTVPRVNTFYFVAAVPVEVDGIEAQVSFAATPQWDVAATAAYAEGKIKDGVIPCNDYFPADGVPDTGSGVPLIGQIPADNLATCVADYRASNAPLFSGNLQSEYRFPVTPTMDTYVRGLLTYNGNAQNDPANALDDVKDYTLLNLYLGLRSHDGTWDVTLYGKNITDTDRVLRRDPSPQTVPYRQLTGVVAGRPVISAITGVSTYRRITVNEPREFGINVRYAFGSR